jgi:hypothetical protein
VKEAQAAFVKALTYDAGTVELPDGLDATFVITLIALEAKLSCLVALDDAQRLLGTFVLYLSWSLPQWWLRLPAVVGTSIYFVGSALRVRWSSQHLCARLSLTLCVTTSDVSDTRALRLSRFASPCEP